MSNIKKDIQAYTNFIKKNKKEIQACNGGKVLAEHYAQLALLYKNENDENQSAYFTRLAISTLKKYYKEAIPTIERYDKQYIQAIDTGKIARDNIQYHWDGKAPLRITFFATKGDMRVMRMAAAAKIMGISLQLIIRHYDAHRDSMVDTSYFDKVVWINSLPADLPETLAAINNFGSHLIHCHIQCSHNQNPVWLLATCNLPIVCDAYDMVNVQYTPEVERNKNWVPQNCVLEKIWYENCEGVCFRSPYKKYMDRQGIHLRKGTIYIHLPEPILLECVRNRRVEKKVRVLLSYYCEDTLKAYRLLQEKGSFNTDNIEFHAVDYDNSGDTINNVKLAGIMPHNEYKDFVHTFDVAVPLPHRIELVPERGRQDTACDAFGNRYPEYLENGCVLVCPERWPYICNYYRKTNRLLRVTAQDIEDKSFWASLPKKISALKENPADFSYCNEKSAGKKLLNFYRKILSKGKPQ